MVMKRVLSAAALLIVIAVSGFYVYSILNARKTKLLNLKGAFLKKVSV